MLLGGVIHGAWHFPLMLLIGYEYGKEYIGAPLLGLFAFCIFTTATGIISDFLVTIQSPKNSTMLKVKKEDKKKSSNCR